MSKPSLSDEDLKYIFNQLQTVIKEVYMPLLEEQVAELVKGRFKQQAYEIEQLLEKQKKDVWREYAQSRHKEVVENLNKALASLVVS